LCDHVNIDLGLNKLAFTMPLYPANILAT
jgi:hypothetical protein